MTEINIAHFLALLKEEVASYQVPVVDLVAVQTNDPCKVLVAPSLSARTKDETTAQASARLFARAPDAASLARLSQEELRTLIYPVSFFKNKARYLAALPAALAAR
jgi:endonuclease III